jgi:hypothetical protein
MGSRLGAWGAMGTMGTKLFLYSEYEGGSDRTTRSGASQRCLEAKLVFGGCLILYKIQV